MLELVTIDAALIGRNRPNRHRHGRSRLAFLPLAPTTQRVEALRQQQVRGLWRQRRGHRRPRLRRPKHHRSMCPGERAPIASRFEAGEESVWPGRCFARLNQASGLASPLLSFEHAATYDEERHLAASEVATSACTFGLERCRTVSHCPFIARTVSMHIRLSELSTTLLGAVLVLGASQPGCTTTQNDREANTDRASAPESEVAEDGGSGTPVKAIVFQAAGPSAASIQSTVDEFRLALGSMNNANAPGPLPNGRREINWDGGGVTTTALGPTPFDVFLNTRGARMVTPGTGFVQATPEGLAETFGNPTYADIFTPFSQPRLFSAIGSNLTDVIFFVPGTAGATPALTNGFGVVLTDVDQPDGSSGKHHKARGSTSIEYFDADGKLLFSSFAPASPGDGSLTFFGIVLDDARIARVLITAGNSAPGPDDTRETDIVMMDDFIYGEPQPAANVCQTPIH